MGTHYTVSVSLIVSAVLAFAIACFFNAVAGSVGINWGLFKNGTGAVSDYYYIEITPAGWTFSIWAVIYVWQALFLVYGLSTICRRGPNDGYIYCDSNWMPSILYIIYILNMALNISWLFLWDRQYIIAALAVLALIPFTLYIMLFVSCRALIKYGLDFIKAGMRKEIWMVRIFVHNAFGIYATWTTIATLLNLAIVLAYNEGTKLSQSVASAISLSILGFEVLFYSFIDILLLERYTRYLLTPYLVVPFALAGSIVKNWDDSNYNSVITACLLAIAGFMLIVKVTIIFYRAAKKPIFTED